MNPPGSRASPDALLAESLGAAEIVAQRLARWQETVAALTPAEGATLQALADDKRVYVDAFFKAFENLQDILENRCFRTILMLEDEPLAEMSRRDQANRLVQLTALPDEREWVALKKLRNALTHEYPLAPARQAAVLNQAVELAPALRRAEESLKAYAQRRLGVVPATAPDDGTVRGSHD